MNISHIAANMKASEILAIATQVNKLVAQGKTVANFTVGDFNPGIFPIPDVLKNEIKKAFEQNHTNYPPADGVLALRESISAIASEFLGFAPDVASEIVIAGGARPLLYSAFWAVVDPGDKVIFPIPSWNNNNYAYLTSANVIEIKTLGETNYMPSAKEIEPHLKDATLLCLCSPLNPSGTMFNKGELLEICKLVINENKKRDASAKPLYLLFDQMYWMLTFGNNNHTHPLALCPEIKDYVIYIDGCSKAFASTGLRVGWTFAPKHIASRMKDFLGHLGAWAPKAEQVALANYLKNADNIRNYNKEFSAKLENSLNVLHKGIQGLKQDGFSVDSISPQGAIYLSVQLDYQGKTTPNGKVIEKADDLVFYLIDEAGVAFVPFSAFGLSQNDFWFRASVGAVTTEDIALGLDRMRQALAKLK